MVSNPNHVQPQLILNPLAHICLFSSTPSNTSFPLIYQIFISPLDTIIYNHVRQNIHAQTKIIFIANRKAMKAVFHVSNEYFCFRCIIILTLMTVTWCDYTNTIVKYVDRNFHLPCSNLQSVQQESNRSNFKTYENAWNINLSLFSI